MAKALEEATTKGHIALVTAVERLFLEAERMELDVPTYSALMEKLVLDPCSYRPTAVRLLLNLALAKVRCSLQQATGSSRTWVGVRMGQDSPVVPLVPESLSEVEAKESLLADAAWPVRVRELATRGCAARPRHREGRGEGRR